MIGDVEIPNRTVLAPMAGVTNSAFRTIAKELGAGLVVMEMVSDKGIQYNNEKTLHLIRSTLLLIKFNPSLISLSLSKCVQVGRILL